MKKRINILMLLMALVMAMTPIGARAADTKVSEEVILHDDWTWDNLSTSEPGFNEVFKATVAFMPTNVTARANQKTITVMAECNTAVRVILIEWSHDKKFWTGEQRWYRNVRYKEPVMVTRRSQQKYWPDRKCYTSSTFLTYTQGKRTLCSWKTYHPNDQWGYLEANQDTVNTARQEVSFRKQFLIQNVPDCRTGYYVRLTYYYTSVTGCGTVRSKKTVVKVR